MILDTKIAACSPKSLEDAFRAFLKKEESYRKKFLQKNYQHALDGYSFYGQEDSLNQYADDLLHSFVLSDFTPIDQFPEEFHSYLKNDFHDTLTLVQKIERQWLQQFGDDQLAALYEQKMGHMISCNYYPATKDLGSSEKVRLSPHTDISFLTVFPYGIDAGLSYQNHHNHIIPLGAHNTIPLFSGYAMELLSENKIPALLHQVDLPKNQHSERFSFAFFSIPKPGCRLEVNNSRYSCEEFYQKYLELF